MEHLDFIEQSVTTGGAGNLVLGSATTGKRALGAGQNGKVLPYRIIDGSTWETGLGTYTHSGTVFARTSRRDSSSGSALNVTTSATLAVAFPAFLGQDADRAALGAVNGGRLSVGAANTPILSSDVIGATVLRYTPYASSMCKTYDGNRVRLQEFSEVTLTPTLVSGKNYDVFQKNSDLSLVLSNAWTNDKTRADTIVRVNGLEVANADNTYTWLGTIRASGTNAMEDSVAKPWVWNRYQQVPLAAMLSAAGGEHTYSVDAFREWGGVTNRLGILVGAPTALTFQLSARMYMAVSQVTTAVYVGKDAVDGSAGAPMLFSGPAGSDSTVSNGGSVRAVPGLTELVCVQRNHSGSDSPTFSFAYLTATIWR